MRKSRVLEKLRIGEATNCFKVNSKDAQISELASMMGFDCIWVDMEHSGLDWSVLASHVWATKSQNTDLMVRVSRGSYSDYIRPLELDATGIMVPHIMNLQDAKDVINMVRFHPQGRRPIDGGNADGGYSIHNFAQYLDHSNSQRFVILQIEDPEPLDDLEEIAQLEGYDMLFFGPGDFSQGIGKPGQWDEALLIETRHRVAEVANRFGKFAGTVGSSNDVLELKNMGYHFINMGADVIAIKEYCNHLLQSFGGEYEQAKSTSYFK